jgi:hypothetical protein
MSTLRELIDEELAGSYYAEQESAIWAKRTLDEVYAALAELERLAAIGRAVEAMPSGYALEHDTEFVGGEWRYMDDDGRIRVKYGDTAAEAMGVESAS